MDIGNGSAPTISGTNIKIPQQFLVRSPDSSDLLSSLITAVYPNLNLFQEDPYTLMGRIILTTTNEYVDEINTIIIGKYPGESKTLLSYDVPLDEKYKNCQDLLHTLSFPGLPPHTLLLKNNCLVILLRNLNPCGGLCNGTRLICDAFHDHLLSCFIAFGEYKGKHVFIPKIPLEMSRDERCAIPFKRTQFPVKLCFAMTINKSQGQTLEFAGIFLRRPVFCHGQLYVAMSRAKNAASIKMLIYDEIDNSKTTNATANIVYSEIIAYLT
ncbi:unnamed protein product [Cuscuta campestris]|uniref:DNA helicase Pif1-like 2B domain-containing protein n=1 Tax=Cuscuta campestris TaxID=132261 RepID=A0A484L3W0_9ASTE|nr:unnamed protein product [Cuscuta campestris]